MTSLARGNGDSGALFELSGTVPSNATWSEYIYFREDGAVMPITGLEFKMTLRSDPESDSADITLSTASGTLVITTDPDGVQVLQVLATAGTLNSYRGDFVADLASQDDNAVVTLWAHGILSIRPNPVSF